jgi:hypothetical protein
MLSLPNDRLLTLSEHLGGSPIWHTAPRVLKQLDAPAAELSLLQKLEPTQCFLELQINPSARIRDGFQMVTVTFHFLRAIRLLGTE